MITKLRLKDSVLTVDDLKFDLAPNAEEGASGYDELRYWQTTRDGHPVQHCHLFYQNTMGPAIPCENMGDVLAVEALVLPYFKAHGG